MRRTASYSMLVVSLLYLPLALARADTPLATNVAPVALQAAIAGAAGTGTFVSRDLEALWYRDEPDKTRTHGVTRIRATILPNPERHVRVGVLEEYSGATGAQWRTSVWVASFIASASLGKELTEYRYDISCDGFIDGPSAGALMAVGFMAAMTGASILTDVTMTGAVAPDGAVVSVGGIPEKILAAKAVGKRKVGIPAGQAKATGADGKEVDVVALGKEHGVEVKEIHDIYDAYELLTGTPLQRPVPIAVAKMEIGAAFGKLLRERAAELLVRAKKDLALVKGDKTAGVDRMLGVAKAALRGAQLHLDKDAPAAAYVRSSRAASAAKAAVRVAGLAGNVKYAASAGSIELSTDAIDSLEKELEAAATSGKLAPLVLIAGYSAVSRARGFLELVRSMLGKAIEQASQKVTGDEAVLRAVQQSGVAFLPALYLSYADLSIDLARAVMKNSGDFGVAVTINPAGVKSASRALVSAASGNVEYIDALLLADVAKQKNMTLDDVRVAFAQNERSYLLANRLAQTAVATGLDKNLSIGGHLSRLQKAANSYVESALVVTKYYSLDADVTSTEEKVRRDRALDSLLRRAELASREAAQACFGKLGFVSPEAQLYYQAGVKEAKSKNMRSQLRALRSFWLSNTVSRVALMVLNKAS